MAAPPPAVAAAHERSTGPEVWTQTGVEPDDPRSYYQVADRLSASSDDAP